MCADHYCRWYVESRNDKGEFLHCMYCECRSFRSYK